MRIKDSFYYNPCNGSFISENLKDSKGFAIRLCFEGVTRRFNVGPSRQFALTVTDKRPHEKGWRKVWIKKYREGVWWGDEKCWASRVFLPEVERFLGPKVKSGVSAFWVKVAPKLDI